MWDKLYVRHKADNSVYKTNKAYSNFQLFDYFFTFETSMCYCVH
jgi:hypothetical protein